MNPIVCLLHNNIALSRRAIATMRAQDIPVEILAVNNDSNDGTAEWLRTQRDLMTMHLIPQMSVAAAWNTALKFWFYAKDAEYALVVNSDVELRPDTMRHLLADGGGFVTAVGTRDPEKIKREVIEMDRFAIALYRAPDPAKKRPHPDFSCFLIRRWVFEKVGPFDERFEIAFCEDSDYHCRMQQAGIRAEALELPFLHHGSATVKNAAPVEARRIQHQADLNRKYFRRKWGFEVGSSEYYAFFQNEPPVEEPIPSSDLP